MLSRFWRLPTLLLLGCAVGCSRGEPVREQATARAEIAGRASAGHASAGAPAAQPNDASRDPFVFDPRLFHPKGAPEPGDWLAANREQGQTFREFEQESTLRPTAGRRTIVLQPLGDFTEQQQAVLATLQRATTLYFGLPVEIAKRAPLPTRGRRIRHRDGVPLAQYLTSEILDSLSHHTPEHAIAYLGVTFQDLYPEPAWNFVFGEAELSARVGVYSLVRFTPEFNHEASDDAARRRFVRRAIQLLAHETGHIFGIKHCTAFECVMNGSNSLSESDRAPIEPCHECLHKLAFALHAQPLPRYRELARFYEEQGLSADAEWLKERAASLAQ